MPDDGSIVMPPSTIPATNCNAPGITPDTTVDMQRAAQFVLDAFGPTTLVAIDPSQAEKPRGFWLDECTLPRARDWLTARQQAEWNIYYTMNATSPEFHRKPNTDNITALRGIAIDIDAKDGRTAEDCREIIDGLPLQPSVVVWSGGGYQALWLFDQPLPMNEYRDRVYGLGQRLCGATGSDAVQSLEHLFRLPFTTNYPNARKQAAGRRPSPAYVDHPPIRQVGVGQPGATQAVVRHSLEALEAAFQNLTIPTVGKAGGTAAQAGTGSGRPTTGISAASGAALNLSGQLATVFANNTNLPDLAAAARAGLEQPWDQLSDEEKNTELATMLALSGVRAIADTLRTGGFINIVAACARSGAPDARELCRAWAKTSTRYNNDDAGFDSTFDSFGPAQPDDITIATLIHHAKRDGYEPPWEQPNLMALPPGGIRRVSDIPPVMDHATALAVLHDYYAFTHDLNGKAVWLRHTPWGWEETSKEDMQESLSNRMVRMMGQGQGKQGPKLRPAYEWLRQNPQRREYERAVYLPSRPFDPSGAPLPVPATPGELNMWEWSGLSPRAGNCNLILWHLEHIVCRGDRACFAYLMKWLAHLVQKPGEAPRVVVILMSQREGTGKSMVGDIMRRIVGERASCLLNTPEAMLGTFNENLEKPVFIQLEEVAFPGEHVTGRKLRAAITAPTWTIHKKYCSRYDIPNRAHIMMATNADWAVQAGDLARRFFILDVDDRIAGNAAHFGPLHQEIENGGAEAFMDVLNKINLTGWEPWQAVPRTAALRDQQILSAPAWTRWALDAEVNGVLGVVRPMTAGGAQGVLPSMRPAPAQPASGWNDWYPTANIRQAINEFAKQSGERGPLPHVIAVGKWLRRCGFQRKTVNGETHWLIPDQVSFGQAVRTERGIV